MDHASFWWQHVAGPARLLHDAVESAYRHRVVLVEEPPYPEEFAYLVQERLRRWDSSLLIETVQDGGITDAGEWLIQRCGRHADYHPLDGSRAEVIAKRNWLAGRVYFISDVQEHAAWLTFAVEYARHSTPDNGLIVLFYRGDCPLSGPRKGVAVLRRGDYFTAYDMQWFAAYCISEHEERSEAVRDYRTQVLARIAGGDPQLCAEMAAGDIRGNPLDQAEALTALYPGLRELTADRKRLDIVLWEAQLQIAFPLLERLRRRFIDAYRDEFQSVLPQRDDFGVELNEPEDMEVRHMWFYYFKGGDQEAGDGAKGRFHAEEDSRVFRLLYYARNHLAHLKPLDHDTVMKLLLLDTYEPERV